MANKRVEITRQQAVDRAKKDCGRKVKYKLGKGGFDCTAEFADQSGEADCSGAVSHFIGTDRQTNQIPGGWIETSLVYQDAALTHAFFRQVPVPQIGDVVVYPDKGKSQGHIGMITAVDSKNKPTYCAHCTARSSLPSAMVNEKWSVFWGPNFTKRGCIYAAPKGYIEEDELEKTRVIVNGKEYEGRWDAETQTNMDPLTPEEKNWSMKRGAKYEWDGAAKPKTLKITYPETAGGVYSTDSDDESA